MEIKVKAGLQKSTCWSPEYEFRLWAEFDHLELYQIHTWYLQVGALDFWPFADHTQKASKLSHSPAVIQLNTSFSECQNNNKPNLTTTSSPSKRSFSQARDNLTNWQQVSWTDAIENQQLSFMSALITSSQSFWLMSPCFTISSGLIGTSWSAALVVGVNTFFSGLQFHLL